MVPTTGTNLWFSTRNDLHHTVLLMFRLKGSFCFVQLLFDGQIVHYHPLPCLCSCVYMRTKAKGVKTHTEMSNDRCLVYKINTIMLLNRTILSFRHQAWGGQCSAHKLLWVGSWWNSALCRINTVIGPFYGHGREAPFCFSKASTVARAPLVAAQVDYRKVLGKESNGVPALLFW